MFMRTADTVMGLYCETELLPPKWYVSLELWTYSFEVRVAYSCSIKCMGPCGFSTRLFGNLQDDNDN